MEQASPHATDQAGPVLKSSWHPSLVRCLSATVAGVLFASGITFALYPFLQFTNLPELGISPTPEAVEKFRAAHHEFWPRNHALAYGLIGFCVGISWGVATSNKSRFASALVAGLAAMVGGLIAGYATGPFYAKAAIESADHTLVQSAVFHSAVWIGLLVPAIFSIGYFQESAAKATNSAISVSIIGIGTAMLYLISASILFPNENLANLIPDTSGARALWVVVMSLSVGVGGFLILRPSKRFTTSS